jgi:hypothetical protein
MADVREKAGPRRWLPGGVVAALVVAALVVAAGGCSLVVDASGQCSSDDECVVSRGLPGTVCDMRQHACVRPATYCSTNRECVDRAGGEPFACVEGQCVGLLSEDCQKVLATPAEYSSDEAVRVGVLSLIAGNPVAGQGRGAVNAIELARNDFVSTLRGLPPVESGGPARPLVVVVCNEAPDATRAARHLVEKLKVPALIGPLASGASLAVAQEVTVPNDVLQLIPAATSHALTKIVDRGLVWRTDAVDAKTVGGMSALAALVEAKLRAGPAPVVSAPDGLKVAYLHRGDILGTAVQPLFLDVLTFNGKTAAGNLASGTYKDVDYGDATAEPAGRAIEAALAFRPHVVIMYGLGEIVPTLSLIEQRWPADAPYRPHYVLHASAYGVDWASVVGGDDDFRRRVLGVLPSVDPKDRVGIDIKTRYDAAYASDTGAIWSTPAQAYFDSFYLFAYAATAAGASPLTGPALAEGMGRIGPPGTPIDASNPGKILDAVIELRSGRNVDYSGAMGNVVFDQNGEYGPPLFTWCLSAERTSVPSGLRFDEATSTLVGEDGCD